MPRARENPVGMLATDDGGGLLMARVTRAGSRVRSAVSNVRSAVAMALAGALLPGAAVLAADADEQQFEQITVTAKKVEQSIYDAPVAVSAFSVKELEARHADNLMDVGNFV